MYPSLNYLQSFTQLYEATRNHHPAQRELAALRLQLPYMLAPLGEQDLFAGRLRYPTIGLSAQDGGFLWYCRFQELTAQLTQDTVAPPERQTLEELIGFWERENSQSRLRATYPPTLQQALPSDNWTTDAGVAFPLYRMAGSYLDFDKLIRLGIPGLRSAVMAAQQSGVDGAHEEVYAGMVGALDLLIEAAQRYAMQARQQASTAHPQRAQELQIIAAILDTITHRPPQSFREGIQLLWLYAVVSEAKNYGRLDSVLGDLYAADRDSGRLSRDEAARLCQSLWQLMAARQTIFEGRVIIGGKGRRNPLQADRLALLLIETTRRQGASEPQLSLRCYQGMDERLMAAALDCLQAGRTYPILYNDAVNIPAVGAAFGVQANEAEQYVPFGCGEYVLNHRSFGSPNGVINLTKALELVIHDGIDAISGQHCGLALKPFGAHQSFEELFETYAQVVDFYLAALARQEIEEYRFTATEASFLFMSMLYDDCIGRGRGMFDGGVRYLGGTIETYGNSNAANSLLALKTLLYEQHAFTPQQLQTMLSVDFTGFSAHRALLAAAPKYGNDNDEADAMAVRVHEQVCRSSAAQAARVGLHSYLVVIVNNHANTILGRATGASADGRQSGGFLANANNPAPGTDTAGVTALLNSLVKLNPALHAGAVQNLKLSPQLFGSGMAGALIRGYFAQGGTQLMITVVDRHTLERALHNPQEYQQVFVRVGGFSMRFVELEPDVQREVLSRTLY
jgi:pyruvate-formate lyase